MASSPRATWALKRLARSFLLLGLCACCAFAQLPPLKLKPHVRMAGPTRPDPVLPLADLEPFLSRSRVVSRQELPCRPKILAIADGRAVASEGDAIFASRVTQSGRRKFSVVRITRPYVDPTTEKILAYEAVHLGEARLEQRGTVSRLRVTQAREPIHTQDILLPPEPKAYRPHYVLKEPAYAIKGQIMTSLGIPASQFGVRDRLVINRGKVDGVHPGHVLKILSQRAQSFAEHLSEKEKKALKHIPSQEVGKLVILRSFDHVSFAMILDAHQPIYLKDVVRGG